MDVQEKERRDLLQLRRWHITHFLNLGFGYRESELLELAEVDWRAAAALLARGCPHDTAILILI